MPRRRNVGPEHDPGEHEHFNPTEGLEGFSGAKGRQTPTHSQLVTFGRALVLSNIDNIAPAIEATVPRRGMPLAVLASSAIADASIAFSAPLEELTVAVNGFFDREDAARLVVALGTKNKGDAVVQLLGYVSEINKQVPWLVYGLSGAERFVDIPKGATKKSKRPGVDRAQLVAQRRQSIPQEAVSLALLIDELPQKEVTRALSALNNSLREIVGQAATTNLFRAIPVQWAPEESRVANIERMLRLATAVDAKAALMAVDSFVSTLIDAAENHYGKDRTKYEPAALEAWERLVKTSDAIRRIYSLGDGDAAGLVLTAGPGIVGAGRVPASPLHLIRTPSRRYLLSRVFDGLRVLADDPNGPEILRQFADAIKAGAPGFLTPGQDQAVRANNALAAAGYLASKSPKHFSVLRYVFDTLIDNVEHTAFTPDTGQTMGLHRAARMTAEPEVLGAITAAARGESRSGTFAAAAAAAAQAMHKRLAETEAEKKAVAEAAKKVYPEAFQPPSTPMRWAVELSSYAVGESDEAVEGVAKKVLNESTARIMAGVATKSVYSTMLPFEAEELKKATPEELVEILRKKFPKEFEAYGPDALSVIATQQRYSIEADRQIGSGFLLGIQAVETHKRASHRLFNFIAGTLAKGLRDFAPGIGLEWRRLEGQRRQWQLFGLAIGAQKMFTGLGPEGFEDAAAAIAKELWKQSDTRLRGDTIESQLASAVLSAARAIQSLQETRLLTEEEAKSSIAAAKAAAKSAMASVAAIRKTGGTQYELFRELVEPTLSLVEEVAGNVLAEKPTKELAEYASRMHQWARDPMSLAPLGLATSPEDVLKDAIETFGAHLAESGDKEAATNAAIKRLADLILEDAKEFVNTASGPDDDRILKTIRSALQAAEKEVDPIKKLAALGSAARQVAGTSGTAGLQILAQPISRYSVAADKRESWIIGRKLARMGDRIARLALFFDAVTMPSAEALAERSRDLPARYAYLAFASKRVAAFRPEAEPLLSDYYSQLLTTAASVRVTDSGEVVATPPHEKSALRFVHDAAIMDTNYFLNTSFREPQETKGPRLTKFYSLFAPDSPLGRALVASHEAALAASMPLPAIDLTAPQFSTAGASIPAIASVAAAMQKEAEQQKAVEQATTPPTPPSGPPPAPQEPKKRKRAIWIEPGHERAEVKHDMFKSALHPQDPFLSVAKSFEIAQRDRSGTRDESTINVYKKILQELGIELPEEKYVYRAAWALFTYKTKESEKEQIFHGNVLRQVAQNIDKYKDEIRSLIPDVFRKKTHTITDILRVFGAVRVVVWRHADELAKFAPGLRGMAVQPTTEAQKAPPAGEQPLQKDASAIVAGPSVQQMEEAKQKAAEAIEAKLAGAAPAPPTPEEKKEQAAQAIEEAAKAAAESKPTTPFSDTEIAPRRGKPQKDTGSQEAIQRLLEQLAMVGQRQKVPPAAAAEPQPQVDQDRMEQLRKAQERAEKAQVAFKTLTQWQDTLASIVQEFDAFAENPTPENEEALKQRLRVIAEGIEATKELGLKPQKPWHVRESIRRYFREALYAKTRAVNWHDPASLASLEELATLMRRAIDPELFQSGPVAIELDNAIRAAKTGQESIQKLESTFGTSVQSILDAVKALNEAQRRGEMPDPHLKRFVDAVRLWLSERVAGEPTEPVKRGFVSKVVPQTYQSLMAQLRQEAFQQPERKGEPVMTPAAPSAPAAPEQVTPPTPTPPMPGQVNAGWGRRAGAYALAGLAALGIAAFINNVFGSKRPSEQLLTGTKLQPIGLGESGYELYPGGLAVRRGARVIELP